MALGTIGSGLDIPSLVSQLVAAERAPAQNRINSAGSAATAKLSALSTIKSSMSSLKTSLESLSKNASTASYKATVPEGAGFSASMATGAAPGRYDIKVISLSEPQKLTSASFQAEDAVGSGTLNFAWGEDQSLDVVIEDGSTLRDIAAAINKAASGKGVTASVLNVDGGQRLVLNAVNPGQDGALTITASAGSVGLDGLTYSGQPGGLTETVAASDAKVQVDGFERTSSSNTIADLIPGVTLTLTKADADSVKTLTIAQDNTPLKTNLQAFVASYNATVGVLKSSSSYNAATDTASALTGDSLVRGMQTQLRNLFSGSVAELKAIGVSIAKDGTLSFNAGDFDKVMVEDPGAVDRLLGESGRLTTNLKSAIDSHLDSSNGTLSLRTESLNKQIKKLEGELDSLDLRMERISARYTSQFNAMDVLVTQLQSTSNYLTQQLANLQASTKK